MSMQILKTPIKKPKNLILDFLIETISKIILVIHSYYSGRAIYRVFYQSIFPYTF